MQLIERDCCVVTGASDLEPLHCFPQFPVFMGCLAQPAGEDLKADMEWCISRGSGLIQLGKVLPLEVLYPESHGAGAIGALWEAHHRAFARFIHKFAPSSVLEVGGAHGILSKEYRNLAKIPWTVIEPNPSPVQGCEARFIRGFFDDSFSCDEEFEAVLHSHVFEHIYQPDQFMATLAHFMGAGRHLLFSLPHLEIMLERKYTNCINFEHTAFLSEPYVEYLLAEYGFRLQEKEYFMDDHSIFYAAVRDPSVAPVPLPPGLYEKNKHLYLEYLRYHEDLVRELNQKIADSAHPVYLFGAHVFAQYLTAFGLDTSRIVCLLDNDPSKQGKRLYGTDLKVHSPKILREVAEPWVILKAGVYNGEIRQDILENINSGTTFL
jgi:hypothetical protein